MLPFGNCGPHMLTQLGPVPLPTLREESEVHPMLPSSPCLPIHQGSLTPQSAPSPLPHSKYMHTLTPSFLSSGEAPGKGREKGWRGDHSHRSVPWTFLAFSTFTWRS